MSGILPACLHHTYNLIIKIIREIPLTKLRCKQGHVLKSTLWILFRSKSEREEEGERKKYKSKEIEGNGGEGEKTK